VSAAGSAAVPTTSCWLPWVIAASNGLRGRPASFLAALRMNVPQPAIVDELVGAGLRSAARNA
jgi:hypothetical protein